MERNAYKYTVSELGHILPTAENPNTPPHVGRYVVNADAGPVYVNVDDADEIMRSHGDLKGMYTALCLYEFPHCYSVDFISKQRREILFVFQIHRQLACVVVDFFNTHNAHVIKETSVDDVAMRVARLLSGNSVDDACKIAASETANSRMSFLAYLGGS